MQDLQTPAYNLPATPPTGEAIPEAPAHEPITYLGEKPETNHPVEPPKPEVTKQLPVINIETPVVSTISKPEPKVETPSLPQGVETIFAIAAAEEDDMTNNNHHVDLP